MKDHPPASPRSPNLNLRLLSLMENPLASSSKRSLYLYLGLPSLVDSPPPTHPS
jgi:hypothetical protein